MYAVIVDHRGKNHGKQYLVREGERVRVDLMDVKTGSKVVFDRVLLVSGKDGVKAGRPVVDGAKVEATVLAEVVKGEKLIVFHKRRRKFMRRKNGHRQRYTDLKVERIG